MAGDQGVTKCPFTNTHAKRATIHSSSWSAPWTLMRKRSVLNVDPQRLRERSAFSRLVPRDQPKALQMIHHRCAAAVAAPPVPAEWTSPLARSTQTSVFQKEPAA